MLSWVAAVLVLTSVFLAGRRTTWAWPIGLTSALIWLYVAHTYRDGGMIAMQVALSALYAFNLVRDLWARRPRRRPERTSNPLERYAEQTLRDDIFDSSAFLRLLKQRSFDRPRQTWRSNMIDAIDRNLLFGFLARRRENAERKRLQRELDKRLRQVRQPMGERLAQTEDQCASEAFMPMPAPTPQRPLAECKDCRSVVFADVRENFVQVTRYEPSDYDIAFVPPDQDFYCGLCRPAYDAVHIIGDGAHYFVRREAKAQCSDMPTLFEYVECDEQGVVLGDERDAAGEPCAPDARCCAVTPCYACRDVGDTQHYVGRSPETRAEGQ